MIDWIKAARLRTLPLSMSGIIMGSFIARWKLLEQGKTWDWTIFALALMVTLLYQVLSNFANDYGDGVKGTDQNRIGEAEQRAVASGKISAINARGLGKAFIPVPSKEEQERIVSILDKFDTLTNSISEGLPKEIALRKQQYEYYRDKLLTFPKKEEA